MLLYYTFISPPHAYCMHLVNAAVLILIDIIHIPLNSSSFNCRILVKSTTASFCIWHATGIWGPIWKSYPGWVTSPTGRTWDKWTLEWKRDNTLLFSKPTFWPCEKGIWNIFHVEWFDLVVSKTLKSYSNALEIKVKLFAIAIQLYILLKMRQAEALLIFLDVFETILAWGDSKYQWMLRSTCSAYFWLGKI